MGADREDMSLPAPPPSLRGCFADPASGFRGQQEGRKGSRCLLSSPQALKELKDQTEAIPCVVGDEEVWTSDMQYQLSVSPAGPRGSAIPLNPGARKHTPWGFCLQRGFESTASF